ncbi:FtsX-like permease family protein [Pollutibacter soli]|uniref:FtsX-like permease family protein n=1 Tax=Pollutibacter soli TaxID=3034157 RepID=UPI003013AF6F
MNLNIFKTAFRHFNHNRLYFVINISGLALAATCLFLAILYVRHENSYDNFHQHQDRFYRIITTRSDSKGMRATVAGTGQPQGPAFQAAIPEIEEYTRLMGGDIYGTVLSNGKPLELQMLFTDSSFFRLFNFPLIAGDTATALKTINSVVITETVARKFFNTTDVVGKLLEQDADPSAERLKKPLVIGGVVKDLPDNSSIRFEILLPLSYMQLSFTDQNWLNQYLGTFIRLKPGADLKTVSEKFDRVAAAHAKQQVDESMKLYHFDPKISYGLQPVSEMHMHPMLTGDFREGGIVNESNPIYWILFLGISVFILLMAGINFVNISIAGSLKRAKEVGVRKISGGSKLQIIVQFLLESTIVCSIAIGLGLMITHFLLPVFNQLTVKNLHLSDNIDPATIGIFFLVLIVIILFTGFYPAYILSGFKPREVLYNKQRLSGKNWFGRGLIVFQFAMAVFFIISTLIYYNQMNYISTKKLGYNPDYVIRTNIFGDRPVEEIQSKLRAELSDIPSIKFLSFGADGSEYEVKVEDKLIMADHLTIDEYRLPALDIKLKLGRNIDRNAFPADKHHSVLVNEAFVRAARLSSPIGVRVRTSDYYDKEEKTIIGVVEDFHDKSLHKVIQPMVLFPSDWNSGGIWIKIEKSHQREAIAAVTAAFKKVMPTAVFKYQYLDELNARAYFQELRWQKVTLTAAVVSILICCMGLFGLSHQSTQRRIREIGIRKILGARVGGIVGLISKDFLQLVSLSVIIAAPLAWMVMQKWLDNFAYRTDIGWGIFAAAAAIAIVLSFLTIASQTIKAATANPVESLKEL